jgi:hypothetical protein
MLLAWSFLCSRAEAMFRLQAGNVKLPGGLVKNNKKEV